MRWGGAGLYFCCMSTPSTDSSSESEPKHFIQQIIEADIQAGKKANVKKNFLIKKNSDFNNFVKKLISSRKIN